MASVTRFRESRQFWRMRTRMALIRVPAWPMPIHQTKWTMSKPQATGWLMPQVPRPLTKVTKRA
jgi:hypothetical protein